MIDMLLEQAAHRHDALLVALRALEAELRSNVTQTIPLTGGGFTMALVLTDYQRATRDCADKLAALLTEHS